jgi:hypothetical protein
MYSGKFVGTYWKLLKAGRLPVERQQFVKTILGSDRSDKAIFEIIMKIHTHTSDNIILGDRTPSHLYHVKTLKKWFPNAKIIHTFRDPRAIIASQLKRLLSRRADIFLHKQSAPVYTFMLVTYMTMSWLRATKLHFQYKDLYPESYYLSKFENIIEYPKAAISELCEFLEFKFDPNMLNPPRVDSSFAADEYIGFDTSVLYKWQSYLQPWIKCWILFWTRNSIQKFNYPY